MTKHIRVLIILLIGIISNHVISQVTLVKEVKITDSGLHFNGSKVSSGTSNSGDNAPYDFFFGRSISAHGDAVKDFGNFVFMTWYRGGKSNRHMMLSRYNKTSGVVATIEFPHRHTGYQNRYWIGESHNTIAVGISPIDGTIHLLYDMHAYSASRPSDGSLAQDYFRYSYSIKNAATLPDAEFTIDKFVLDNGVAGDYKHLRTPGNVAQSEFVALTYPTFFLNDQGELLFFMREGGNNNGMYKFSKYDASKGEWQNFTDFNRLNAKSQAGITYNWGLYGDIKYVNGKIRIGFQRRSSNNNDKYQYQNGIYYAYSDDPSGATQWKNYQGEDISLPLLDADDIKVMEPGDYVSTTQKDKVHIVGNFDWTVTENEDIHFISRVKDNQNNVTKFLHTYKPSGATDFITSEDFSGGTALYTSGNDVFLIGLNNGRVFVEKTEGGTNNFERVYEATGGRTYDHGVVHIKDGKAYYYLMEDSSGSAQPLYLQIIDLDIVKEPFRVSLSSPFDGQTYYVDDTIKLSADAVDENGSITKVEFNVNGNLVGQDDTEPYAINWIPTNEGSYTIQAKAYNANNNSVSSTEITINVVTFDPNDLAGKIYRLKNVATGKYLKSSDANVIPSDYIAGDDALNWKFVKTNIGSSEYYNIDSEVNGVLRGAGAGAGNTIISTNRSSPNSDVDKVWTSTYIESEDTYRFSVRDSNNFLYHQDDDKFYNIVADVNDARSKWKLELANTSPLSIDDNVFKSKSINVYPNPTNGNFTIVVNGINKAHIKIYNLIGKLIYETSTEKKTTLINNYGRFKSGIYLVRVLGDNHKVYNQKLIIE
ncbi:BNR-4 repeat-containing protein [Polaribacter aestuariivivens]|uniref:T9SS type A sorting domain-containing protein n=1 Tax=Polaribacter aestuariivivens TaxID=2304626 RepID=UPI003F4942CD